MSNNMKENKMGTMPVGQLIVSMSWPAVLSMLIQALYNVVDSIFVSMINEEALSAVTYIFPVQMLLIAIGVGTGVGVNSLIARRLGAGKLDEASMAASHGYRISFFNWAAFALFGLFFSKIFVGFFTNTPFIFDNAVVYMQVITIGSLFVFVQVSTEKILQATGNMIFPMICSIIGAVVNIIMDPFLIFGIGPFPKWGVMGAAVATVIGQLFSMILGQILLFKKEHHVEVKLRGFKMQGYIFRDIYAVGLPAILMQAMASVLQFGLNSILSGLSETAIAVNGVYGRLQSFIFMPVFGLNQGAMPVMGYNYGARDKERVMKAFKISFYIAFVIMLIGLILFQLFPKGLLGLFNASDGMYMIGIPALRTISLCFLPAAFGIITASFFQATGHGMMSLWGTLLRQLIGILPLAWLLARTGGLTTVWYAFPLAEILGFTYCVIAFRYIYKKDIITLETK